MDNHQTKHVISISILLSAIIISNPTLASNGCDFPAIFNFGDSNSDTGGLSASIMETLSPFGMTFFKRPAGRFSDGRLIIDFIAQSIGLPFLHAYLDSLRANFSNGANFATAASTIRLPNTTIFQGGVSPFSLDVQWWQFTQFKSRSQLDYNQEGVFKELVPKKDYFSRALYTFDIGQNDLTAVNFLNMTKEEVATGITAILSDFTAVVKNVYGEGARSFWIHNTGPIGCLAYVLDPTPFTDAQIDDAGCAIPWNELAQHFNKKLNETIVQLRMDLPLAAFTYVDVYSVKYTLFSKAEKLGKSFRLFLRIQAPSYSLLWTWGKYNYSSSSRCGSTVVVNGTASIVGACNDPSVRINWDGVHYTEAANKWVFDQIVDGAFSDPPIPLKMACRKVAH